MFTTARILLTNLLARFEYNFWKTSDIAKGSNIKPFFFLRQISAEGDLLFYRPSSFKFSQRFLGFAVLAVSFSSKLVFFFLQIKFWTAFGANLERSSLTWSLFNLKCFIQFVAFVNLLLNFSITPFPCSIFYSDCLNRSYYSDYALESTDKVTVGKVEIIEAIIIRNQYFLQGLFIYILWVIE